MSIIQLLASSNYIVLNKNLIREIGLEEALLFGELASRYDYLSSQNALDEEGFFYSTIEEIENKTTLSVYKQRKAIKNLERLGFIKVKVKGVPAKRYIYINEKLASEKLANKFVKNSQTSERETNKLDSEKLSGNNNIYNNNIYNNNNKSINKKDKERKKEESKKYDDILQTVENQELQEALREFVKMRNLINKPITNHALELAIKKLDKMANNDTDKITIVNNSVLNSWQGFYPLKEEEKQENNFDGLKLSAHEF